jgi:hypothetical protein
MARKARSTLPLVFGFAVIALLAGCDSDRTLAPSDQADLKAQNSGNGPNISAPSNPVAAAVKSSGSTVVPPSNTTVTAVSARQFDVSWRDNSGSEEGFEVYVAASGLSDFSLWATTGANVTTQTFTGINPRQEYCTRVRAFNGKGASFSVVDDTQIRATVPRGAKSGPISVSTGTSQVSSAQAFTVTR